MIPGIPRTRTPSLVDLVDVGMPVPVLLHTNVAVAAESVIGLVANGAAVMAPA